MGKFTKAQATAMEELARRGGDCGYVHASTAKVLEKRGMIERYGASRLQDWWSITPEGRTALERKL